MTKKIDYEISKPCECPLRHKVEDGLEFYTSCTVLIDGEWVETFCEDSNTFSKDCPLDGVNINLWRSK